MKFTRKQDVQVLFDLIMDHYNGMIGQLDRGGIRPIYDVDPDGNWIWEFWLEGFWQAVFLRPEDWLDFSALEDEDLQGAVYGLTRLQEIAFTPRAELEPMELDADLEANALDFIPNAVQTLHRIRKQQQANLFAGPANENNPKVAEETIHAPAGQAKSSKNAALIKDRRAPNRTLTLIR